MEVGRRRRAANLKSQQSHLVVNSLLKGLSTAHSQHRLHTSGSLIGSTAITPSYSTVRDLGVFIDQDLTMRTHVLRTTSRCFAILRQLRGFRRPFFSLWLLHWSSAVWTIVTVSCLTYPPSLFNDFTVSAKCCSKAHLQSETMRPHQ